MKTIFISSALALAIAAVFTSCSKSTDLYDADAAQKNQQEQKAAQLRKTYSDAFIKEFGPIASNNAWGFDQTTGRSLTRQAVTSTSEIWLIPDNLANGTVKKEGKAGNAVQTEFQTEYNKEKHGKLAQTLDIDFNNYFLQHTDMPKNIKNQIDCIEAWNSNGTGKWEKVTNFEKGKDTDDFTIENTNLISGMNRSSACTTLMKDMGGQPYNNTNDATDPANGKLFRVKYTDGTYNYDYYFHPYYEFYHNSQQNTKGSFLGFYFDGSRNPSGKPSFWCIKIAQADRDPNSIVAEGRVLCEDMGANDFDFNDVVFDAWIMGSGEIKIKVLAHGGKLPIAIDGVDVTLGEMTNTGLATAPTQEFTIPAGKYSSINDIPVTVVPNSSATNGIALTSEKGSAPQKVCVPVGTLWPVEYTRIDAAYTPFTSFVSTSSPLDWMCEYVPNNVYSLE